MSFIHDYAKTFIRTRVSKLSQKVVHISLQLYIYHYSCTLHIICAQWEIKVWTRILGPLRIFSLLSFRPWRNKIKRSRQNSIAKNKIFQIWSFQINKRLLIQLNFKWVFKIAPPPWEKPLVAPYPSYEDDEDECREAHDGDRQDTDLLPPRVCTYIMIQKPTILKFKASSQIQIMNQITSDTTSSVTWSISSILFMTNF